MARKPDEMIGYDYISGNFLNSLELAVLGLHYIPEGELLSIPGFNTAIYNLVYAAAVTGVEEYLLKPVEKIMLIHIIRNIRIIDWMLSFH